MKIYINKNCNGYHWFEGEPLGKAGKLEMPEVTVLGKASYYLDKLFLYAQYEVVLIENDRSSEPVYFLAINNLPEHHRKDTFGRPLNFQLIFAGDNLGEISRFLFAYLSGWEKFAEVFSPMFSAGTVNLICDCDRLNAYWMDLSGRKLKESAGKIFNPGRPVKFIYTKSPETISERFGWNKSDIQKINYKSLDSFAEMEFFESGDNDAKELRDLIQKLTAENQGLEKRIKDLCSENERLAEENKELRAGLGPDLDGMRKLQGKIQDLMSKSQALVGKVMESEEKIKYLRSENERLTVGNEKLKKGCIIALVVAVLSFFMYFFL
ncbi:hypothetical protein [uncultured Parabacteroides sp.]|uniref:hypothetical protein n=1 Tax=uncultured Parabacteroides sp. TaxID=512312 RepID=UPI0026323CCB|nr:hypothetical protein [uncultured Parabacteroides sp.]